MKRIAVTGGKGGTGKSTIATALAVELGKDYKVLLVDADVDCPNDHLLLGIKRKRIESVFQRIPEFNLEKCIGCGKCAQNCEFNAIAMINKKPVFMPEQCNGCSACFISCPVKAIAWNKKEIGHVFKGKMHGIDLLSGELKAKEPFSERIIEALNKRIKAIKKKYDFIIVDTAAGTHCNVISALESADVSLAVTEPTPLGAHDLKLILSLIKTLGLEFEIVLNRAGIGKRELIDSIGAGFGKKVVVSIPYSKKIMKSYSKGIPITHKGIKKIGEVIK